MDNNTVKGLRIGKNVAALGMIALSLGLSCVGIKILLDDLSYMSVLELIQYLTYGAGVMILANGIKSIKIK